MAIFFDKSFTINLRKRNEKTNFAKYFILSKYKKSRI